MPYRIPSLPSFWHQGDLVENIYIQYVIIHIVQNCTKIVFKLHINTPKWIVNKAYRKRIKKEDNLNNK